MSRDEENALIERCKKGDRGAMQELVKTYEPPVYNASYRLLGNQQDAEDVTQTTFMKAFQSLGQYNSAYKFFSWIYRIMSNEAINLMKRRSRSEPLQGDVAANEPSADSMIYTNQVDAELQAAMMTLSEEHRNVIVLRYFSEAGYSQIARILDLPEQTVKSRLFEARRQMKKALDHRGVVGR